ncbi:MAG: carbamoyltransferase, partial [Candidatus Scalindua sp.]|nr:carbamoyltransferase [Candidatus Scalindua sp.]
QTLTIEDNGRFYEVVKEFGRITGVPVLLNTSFNGPGEPIVESPKDALDCFNRLDLDILILEDYIVYK